MLVAIDLMWASPCNSSRETYELDVQETWLRWMGFGPPGASSNSSGNQRLSFALNLATRLTAAGEALPLKTSMSKGSTSQSIWSEDRLREYVNSMLLLQYRV